MKKLKKTQKYINQQILSEKIKKINQGECLMVDVVEIKKFLIVVNGHHTLKAYEMLEKHPIINKLSISKIHEWFGISAFLNKKKTQIDESYFLHYKCPS